jgi:hypothetical protein
MNTEAVAAALRAGVCSDEHRIAAVELLIGHDHWLAHPEFVKTCIVWGEGHDEAWVQFERALERLDNGEMDGSSTQRLILRIAGSLDGADTPLRLSGLSRLDDREARLVSDAIGRACGCEGTHGWHRPARRRMHGAE